jgi:hypothetical protein
VSFGIGGGVAVLRIGRRLTDLRVRLLGSAGPPPALAPGPFLTLVSRLGEDSVAELCAGARRALAGFPAHLYPPHTIHLTILFLDGVDPAAARPAVAAWARGRAPLHVRARGIGYARGSAYLALDGGRSLHEARRALARTVGLETGGWASVRNRVAVANFARFRSPLEADVAARLRALPVPPIDLDLAALELVETDKLLSDAATRRLAEVDLGAGR